MGNWPLVREPEQEQSDAVVQERSGIVEEQIAGAAQESRIHATADAARSSVAVVERRPHSEPRDGVVAVGQNM